MLSSTETPFKISVPDEKLAQLYAKLALATFPDELDGAGRDYGVPLADLRRLVSQWKDRYDRRQHEATLNQELPQFTRDIAVDGHGILNVHYVHKKSQLENAIPLLFVHGWPGSFIEVRKVLPLLVEASEAHPAFHVVALGLPGYAFSEAPKQKGFGANQYAEVGHKLMMALGYQQYVTQGGDWGYLVTRRIASLYGGKHSKAWHTNAPIGEPPHPIYEPINYLYYIFTPYTAAEKEGLKRRGTFLKSGEGYYEEQSTQPQTLGYGLSDSPVGLLAWIYEKLVNWTDDYSWDDDEVLTWVSIYWFSRAGPTASLRIYHEVDQGAELTMNDPPTIPAGITYFPKEIKAIPKTWTRNAGNIVYQKCRERGGHFAAHERPNELVADLREMFGKGQVCFSIVPGHNGFA